MKRGFYLISLFFVSSLYAKSFTHQINDLLLYEEQKKIFNNHKNYKNDKSYNYTKLKELPIIESDSKPRSCITIKKINFEGIKLISKNELFSIAKEYINRCDSANDIKNLVNKINNIYIKRAYITSRAYIKPQNLKSGKLTISAIEGKIEKVEGKGVSTKLIFPFINDSYLNLRDLESGIEQINRLESQKAKMQLYPSKKRGYSKIVITSTKVSKPYNSNISINNYGVKKSGKYQLSASLNIENPLGINDLLSISANTTDKQSSYTNSLGTSISYALPIGKSYMGIRYSAYDYTQKIEGQNQDYKSEGKTKTGEIFSEYKLFHTMTQRGRIDVSLSRKETKNYLSDIYLQSSSSVLSILRVGYTHSFNQNGLSAYAIFKYHRGLDIFGAKSVREDLLTFDKYTLDLSINKRLKTSFPISFNSSLHGQYSKDELISTEYISVGGPYSVRGFKGEYAISGISGLYIRDDLNLYHRVNWGIINLYFGLDYGWIKSSDFNQGGNLLGSSVGVKVSWRDFLLDFYKSYPLRDSNDNDKNNGFVGVSLSYRF